MLPPTLVRRHPLIALNQQRRVRYAAIEVTQRHVSYCCVPLHKAEGVEVTEETKGRLSDAPHKVEALAGCLAPVEGGVGHTVHSLLLFCWMGNSCVLGGRE